LQWVRGNANKAEDSFIRINQQAAIITPQELELLKSRRKPATIAARAIIRRGTGHKYWYSFDDKQQQQIEELATELHKMIFEPILQYPIKSLDLPAGGAVYSAPALRGWYTILLYFAWECHPRGRRKGQQNRGVFGTVPSCHVAGVK
jgi:hypothetical protein